MVLKFNLWLLPIKFAVMGRLPVLPLGLLPIYSGYGGEEGIPDSYSQIKNITHQCDDKSIEKWGINEVVTWITNGYHFIITKKCLI